jgi:hypothetical protein
VPLPTHPSTGARGKHGNNNMGDPVDDLHSAVRRQRDSAEDLIELTSRDVLKIIVDDVARQQDSHHVSVF